MKRVINKLETVVHTPNLVLQGKQASEWMNDEDFDALGIIPIENILVVENSNNSAGVKETVKDDENTDESEDDKEDPQTQVDVTSTQSVKTVVETKENVSSQTQKDGSAGVTGVTVSPKNEKPFLRK